ncbi:flagellar biosynthesis protein FlgA [Candidatus Marinamargulisbacteria bacterium SCGC AG-414-C22]|nr:flagellar biosynthesis protein FlgA [Candidatus Marinamargulisbacteria bacterium SCGC AG-414-C22]
MKKVIIILSILIFSIPIFSQNMTVKLKDIGNIIEVRENQLMGYGIVVGLRGTGDSRSSALSETAMKNLLSKMGVSVGSAGLNSRNIASVMVTADLPAFIKKGQRINVTVSALGDSTSLAGGTLLMTPLMGPDMNTYALAQGLVDINALSEVSQTSQYYRNQATVGKIQDGAIVEAEVPVTFIDQHHITIVLEDPNFITVAKTTEAIKKAGYPGVISVDGNTIKVPLQDLKSSDLIASIADLQNIEISPDQSSKIVIDSKSGTIIIGENVRLFPVAVSHGGISITINDNTGGGLLGGQETVDPIQVVEANSDIKYLSAADTITSLVDSLNGLGASSKDLISIIHALKESGSLIAEIEVL